MNKSIPDLFGAKSNLGAVADCLFGLYSSHKRSNEQQMLNLTQPSRTVDDQRVAAGRDGAIAEIERLLTRRHRLINGRHIHRNSNERTTDRAVPMCVISRDITAQPSTASTTKPTRHSHLLASFDRNRLKPKQTRNNKFPLAKR